MACSLQKQPSQPSTSTTSVSSASASSTPCSVGSSQASQHFKPTKSNVGGQRGSLQETRTHPLEFQWPPIPVSTHTTHLHLTMMNQDPKDLHTARLIIEELRAKVRYQTEHIMKWRKAYAIQIQQHYRYQKEKTDQMNSLTSQLLLLEARLKRKQKQIASIINHRELTIQRQQKIIDTLSSRLLDHGLETIDASYTAELDSLNDSDSAVVLEDIDSDCYTTNTTLSMQRRKNSGAGCGGDGVTIVRSISDAIETNLNKYGGGARRNNCFLRRPDILETVYSVEEDPEPTSDVAEKRDKFKNRSDKALSSSSTEGQIDNVAAPNTASSHSIIANGEKTKEQRQISTTSPAATVSQQRTLSKIPYNAYAKATTPTKITPAATTRIPTAVDNSSNNSSTPEPSQVKAYAQVTNYNRVMSNHRSVTKPKDVKYKRINKAKSKSLEELRGRLKNLVERGSAMDPGIGGAYAANPLPQTAQSYA